MTVNIHPSPVDEATLVETVGFVWSTLFGAEVEPVPASPLDGLTASISIGGQWRATMIVEMEHELALRCASSLLQMDVAELDEALLADAIGEIANVVGGNIKGLLSADVEATLSLPIVARSSQSIVGGLLTIDAGFHVDGYSMAWRLFESR